MGCTSSTPSYVDSSTQHANATEENETVEEKNEDLKDNRTVVVNNNFNDHKNSERRDPVLPESDIVGESLDIGRNDRLMENTDDIVVGNHTKRIKEGKIDEQAVIDILLLEKKESEERRQREMDFLEELSKLSVSEAKPEDVKVNKLQRGTIEHNKANIISEIIEVLPETQEKENVGEDDTLSQSSRTTRWEALADVAAELPPSLTVDPHTGQIYTLK